MTAEVKKEMCESIKGRVVESLEESIDPATGKPEYWVMTFADGSEICFRFMSELVQQQGSKK